MSDATYIMCGYCFRVSPWRYDSRIDDDCYCSRQCKEKGDTKKAVADAIKKLDDAGLDSSKLKAVLGYVVGA